MSAPTLDRLCILDKLTVAVIDHTDHIRLYALYKSNKLAYSFDRKCRSCSIALRALDCDKLRFFIDGFLYSVIVKLTVRQ